MSWHEEVEGIRARREIARAMGGPERVARQHDRGRLTIRERIDGLVDEGSFTEIGQIAGAATYRDGTLTSFVPDPYVAGLAKVNGRDVVVAGEDFTVRGGSGSGPGERNKRDVAFAMAREYRVPVVLPGDPLRAAHGAGDFAPRADPLDLFVPAHRAAPSLS